MSNTAQTLLAPTVHLNGTSEDALQEQVKDVIRALSETMEAMSRATPNARDYYPQGSSAFELARNQRIAMWAQVEKMRGEFVAMSIAIDEQKEVRR